MIPSIHLRSRRGVVLLMVLGILALLSVLAISFVQLSNFERRLSQNYVARTRAVLAAESGVEYAQSRLLEFGRGPASLDTMAELQCAEGNLMTATQASFQLSGAVGRAVSGSMAEQYSDQSDYFALRAQDESAKINLNDSNGHWNLDDDPLQDDPDSDPDLLDAPGRLFKLVEALASALFDPTTGFLVAGALFDPNRDGSRPTLSGDRFQSMDQVRALLTEGADPALSADDWEVFSKHVTLWSWQDPTVLRPTFQLAISAPEDQPQPATEFNIYLYSDFQTGYYEHEPRSPVNVNAAAVEVLQAIIRPVRGWYLYEGEPNSYSDGFTGPWIKAMRGTSFSWKDRTLRNGFGGSNFTSWSNSAFANPVPQSASGNWRLGNGTRYGEARLSAPFSDDLASQIAQAIHKRIHGPGRPGPFGTWDEFTRFIYEMVDTSAQIDDPGRGDLQVFEKVLRPEDERQRFPYRLTQDCDYAASATVITGFDRYMADALLANVNPNAQLNDFNPDFHVFRHVDKAQLTQYTTEFCFQSTGVFSVTSLGVSRTEEAVAAQSTIHAVLKLFHPVRITTQEQFMASGDAKSSYRPAEPESVYDLFEEYTGGIVPAAGADLEMARYSSHNATGGGALGIEGPGRMGPSLCSYPEPLRDEHSLCLESNPGKPSRFSRYDGSLALNSLQNDLGSYPTDVNGQLPTFIAPMGYRWMPKADRAEWQTRSLAAGGMLPVRLGNNPDVISDDIGTMDIAGGRGVMLTWDRDYLPLNFPNAMSFFTDFYEINPQPDPDWKHDRPWQDQTQWVPWCVQWLDHGWSTFIQLNPISPVQEFGLRRVGWNTPSEMPLTPDARGSDGDPLRQTPGVLYADGAFSDVGRTLMYRSANLGSDVGRQGAFCFWVKPHWDAGFSNRMRSLFSMGHVGAMNMHALDLYYLPTSRRRGYDLYSSVGPNDLVGPANEHTFRTPFNLMASPNNPIWPLPVHNLMFGWTCNSWGGSGGGGNALDQSSVQVSGAATDFFPYRIPGQRSMNARQLAFYGHQWNFIGGSYINTLTVNVNPCRNLVEYAVNGQSLTGPVPGNFYMYPTGAITADDCDWYWEEFQTNQNVWDLEYAPEPEHMHMTRKYIRMGGGADHSGPVADSTFDDIAFWATPVDMNRFNDIHNRGRYVNEPLEDVYSGLPADEGITGIARDSVIGLYTSPALDLFKLAGDDISTRGQNRMRVLSAAWTLWWPRYNWRPGAGNYTGLAGDYDNWSQRNEGLQGVDLHSGLTETLLSDPVTGDMDPVCIDVERAGAPTWAVSGCSDGDTKKQHLYENMPFMMYHAPGNEVPAALGPLEKGDLFRYRVYFHVEQGAQPILESPVFDDITFYVAFEKPGIVVWEMTQG